MKKKALKILKTILPLALGFFLIWYSLRNASPQEREQLLENILSAKPGWVLLSVLCGTLSHLSRAYRWKFMLEPMGYKPKFSTNFMAVMVGYLANLGIPRSGEVLRAASLRTYENVPFEKAFGSIISERMADLIILLCIVGLALALQTDNLLAYFSIHNINPLYSLTALGMVLILGILVLIFIKKSHWSPMLRLKKIAKGLLEGMRSILKMKQKWAFLFHTLFIWVMYILMFYVITFTVPAMENVGFGAIMAAFVVGSFAISATNGGIGVYPVAIGAILLFFGIEKQAGEAFGWIVWATQTLLVVILGGLSFLFLPILNRQK